MRFLIVEDDGIKRARYTSFAEHYGLTFTYAATPLRALHHLQDQSSRSQFAGVIADFALNCRRQDHWHHRANVSGPDGDRYTISTGLGVLDWLHRVDPGKPLWALTDVSATHAPLFMSAAALWLEAKPLSLERLYEYNTHAGNRMFEELKNPRSYADLNPNWMFIAGARDSFQKLLDTPYTGVEAFDWLNALTHLTPSISGFVPSLEKAVRELTGNPNIKAHAHSLAPVMAKWQVYLDEVYQDFAVDRQIERWPVLDPDNPPRALSPWDDFNPIINVLGANSECTEFFEADDVRMALRQWRARGEQP